MIDTEALCSKILDLAIRGKLTEQLPEDGSAEDLYAKIQEEKSRLVKEGRIKKEKALPEIRRDEIPFEIPKNWKWVRIGKVINEVIVPQRNKPSFSGDIPWCRIEDRDGIYLNGTKSGQYVSEQTVKEMNLRMFPVGTVLSACSGASIGTILINTVECCTNQTFNGLVCNDLLYNWYLFWFLKSEISRLKSMGSGSAMAYISQDKIRNMLIPLPPIAEQKRIIEKFNDILERIDEIENLQSQYAINVEVLKSKLIDAGIRGKLTEQLSGDGKVEDLYKEIQTGKARILERRKGREDKKIKAIESDMPFEIPSHWKWIRLGDIGLFKKGPFGSALTKSMFVQKGEDTVKVYEQQHAIKKNCELGTYYITREYFDDKMSGFEVMPGDIIISCAGTIGENYIVPDEIEQGIINQALMRVTLAERINKKFFQYYFDANLKKSAQKESNGSAIKNIPPFDVLKNWYFPLTSIEEQKRIVEKIDVLLNFLD